MLCNLYFVLCIYYHSERETMDFPDCQGIQGTKKFKNPWPLNTYLVVTVVVEVSNSARA